MSKRTILIIAVAAIAIAGTLAFRHRGEPDDRIRISGNIELTQVNIAFKVSGRLVERAVDEGDAVHKGQIVARLDRDQLMRQRDREDAALVEARSQLAQADTTVQWTRESQVTDLEQRRADLTQMESRLQQLKAGSRPQEIQESNAAVAAARTENEAKRAQRDWDRAQTLFKRDDISASQYDQYRKNAESAAASLKQAQERFAMVKEGPRKEAIDQARARGREGKSRAVKWSEAQRLDVRRKQDDVAAKRAGIERQRAQIALVDSQLDDTVAASPIDGVALVKSANVGEILAPGIDYSYRRRYRPSVAAGATSTNATSATA